MLTIKDAVKELIDQEQWLAVKIIALKMIDGEPESKRPVHPNSIVEVETTDHRKHVNFAIKFDLDSSTVSNHKVLIERAADWIIHEGDECPVARPQKVIVLMRNGEISGVPTKAGYVRWSHIPSESDVVAYKVVK